MKKFCDLQPEDMVYTIDPKDQSIKELKVLKVGVHPKSRNQNTWVVETYQPLRLPVTDDLMKAASAVAKVTQQFFVPKNASMALLLSKPPTVLCTDLDMLTRFINKDGQFARILRPL